MNILLDMDGVLADFFTSARELLNKKLNVNISSTEYVTRYGKFDMAKYYNITANDFWRIIESDENFWVNIKPFSWAKDLYLDLKSIGNVIIVTTPSMDPRCYSQKIQWLENNLGISPKDVFLGCNKHLMAGNGILIDDYDKNILNFINHGGDAIKVPSNWNTVNLTYDLVYETIFDVICFGRLKRTKL